MELGKTPNNAQVDVLLSFVEKNCSGRRSSNEERKKLRATRMYAAFLEYSENRLSGLFMLSPLIQDKEAAKIAVNDEPIPWGSKCNVIVKVMNIKNRLAILDEYLSKLKEAA